VDPETVKVEKSPSVSKSLKTESHKVQMASSIISKIKLYKVCRLTQLYKSTGNVVGMAQCRFSHYVVLGVLLYTMILPVSYFTTVL
jgi:hypothetical protein